LHHDESIHAFESYTLSKDGTWRYDPAYHGPLMYYVTAGVYRLFGVGPTTARLVPALLGILLIGFAWALARWIGVEAAIAYALLVLISPHFNYFSRFIREDPYSLVFTIGTILAFRRFLETDRARWLTASAALFACAGVTKENAYMTGVLFVVFGLWHLAERIFSAPKGAPSILPAVREAGGWVQRRWTAFATAAAVFLTIWVVFYSAFLRYPEDVSLKNWLAIRKAVTYWMGQHAIARIPGPWYYYFPQLLYYETAVCLAALLVLWQRPFRRDPFLRSLYAGFGGVAAAAIASLFGAGTAVRAVFVGAGLIGAAALLRGKAAPEDRVSPFLRFLMFWALGSLAIYGWAREKVPWLTVHALLPLAILAALGIAGLWRDRGRLAPRLGLAAVGLLAAINASGMLLACFRYGAYDVEKEPKHGEYLAYVQTTWDLVRALDDVTRAKARVAPGQPVVTVTGEATWPLSWYLRDTTTNWVGALETASTPVIVADWNAEGTLQKQLAEHYTGHRVPIRAWWFPDDFWKQGPPAILRWWLFHEVWSQIGSQDAMFYVRTDIDSAGTLAPLQIPILDKSGREYPSDAKTIPARSVGGPGAGPGEFDEPRGVASDAHGNLYVSDTKNNRIEILDGSGRFLRQFGGKGNSPGQFNEPTGIAVDSRGELWIADTWNYRVVHAATDGRILSLIGGGGPEDLFGPRAVLPLNNFVYVADTGNKRIVRYDRDGTRLSQWGGAGSGDGQFIEPVGLAADASGTIYVADTGNHRVQAFDGEGKYLRQFPVYGWKEFYTEPYLAVGPSDTLFVTDSSSGRIAQYDQAGALQRSFRPEQDGKMPTGIALDPFGRLMVTDRGTHRIHFWGLGSVLQ
jgi:uncharacterized protein (TIGR03663 family)